MLCRKYSVKLLTFKQIAKMMQQYSLDKSQTLLIFWYLMYKSLGSADHLYKPMISSLEPHDIFT